MCFVLTESKQCMTDTSRFSVPKT